MYLKSNFGLAPKNSLIQKQDSDSQGLCAFRFGELKSSGRITVSVRCTLRLCLHMLGWQGRNELVRGKNPSVCLCKGQIGQTHAFLHADSHQHWNKLLGGRKREAWRSGILSRAIWITASKQPETGSCQCSRCPRSKMDMRSGLLLVCAWQGSFQLQGAENPAETTKGVGCVTRPELASLPSYLSG